MNTTEYKIQSNVPIPLKGTQRKFPFAAMKVGDSFVCSKTEENTLRQTASRFAKLNQVKFSVLKEEKGISVRCWRIE